VASLAPISEATCLLSLPETTRDITISRGELVPVRELLSRAARTVLHGVLSHPGTQLLAYPEIYLRTFTSGTMV
jgi:hypothetical protein